MNTREQGTVVITRRSITKTVVSNGDYYETVNHTVSVKCHDLDARIDWDQVYDAAVGAVKRQAFNNL